MPNKGHPKAHSRGFNQSKKVGLAVLSLAAVGSLLFVSSFSYNNLTNVFGAERGVSLGKEVAVKQTLEQMRATLVTKEASLSLATKEVSTIESSIATKTAEKLTAETSISETQVEIAAIDAKLGTKLTEADRLALTADKSTLQSSTKTLQIASDTLSKEISTMQTSLTAKQAEVATLESELSTLKTQITQAELEQNLAPVALADTISNASRTSVTSYKILDNDSDADGLDYSSVIVSSDSKLVSAIWNSKTQSLDISPSKSLTAETKSVSLSYSVADTLGARSDAATVTINFEELAKDYTASSIKTSTKVGVAKSASTVDAVRAVAPEFDVASATKRITSKSVGGSAAIAENGDVTFAPAKGFVGTEVVAYEMTDTVGNKVTGSVEFTVEAPLSAVAEKISESTQFNTAKTVSVMSRVQAAAGEVDMSKGSVEITSRSKNGTASVVEGGIVFTPNKGFIGKEAISYKVVSPEGDVVIGEVEIEVMSAEAKVAGKLTMSTRQGIRTELATIDAVKSVSPEFAATSKYISEEPVNGTANMSEDGVINYTPNAGFVGTDTVEYTYEDAQGNKVVGTLEFVIEAPLSTAAERVATMTEYQTPKQTDVMPAVTKAAGEVDMTKGSLEITSTPENGTASIVDGMIKFTPNAGFVGSEVVKYIVTGTDGGAVSGEVVFSISAPDTASAAIIGATTELNTSKNASIVRAVAEAMPDLNVSSSTIEITNGTANGTVEVSADGVFNYTPDANFVGTDTVEYAVTAEDGRVVTGTISFEVLPADVVSAEVISQSMRLGGIASINVDEQVTAVNSEFVTTSKYISTEPVNGTATMSEDGVLNYTPNEGFVGVDTVGYTYEDAKGNKIVGKIEFIVTAPSVVQSNDGNQKLTISINDPYTCGGDIFGHVNGGSGESIVTLELVDTNGVVVHSFNPVVNNDGSYYQNIDYSIVTEGLYTVNFYVNDSKAGAASGKYTANLQEHCSSKVSEDTKMSANSESKDDSENVPKYSSQAEFDINNVNGGALVKTGADLSVIDMVILSSVVVFFAAKLVQSTLMLDPREE